MPTQKEIGDFVDSIAGQIRKPSDVAGRLLEECVELCLAAGVTNDKIMSHVMDSIYNQTGKASRRAGKIIYPSQLEVGYDREELAEEAADVALVLKDLCHITDTDVEAAQDKKWAVFITRKFNVSDAGTLYAIK